MKRKRVCKLRETDYVVGLAGTVRFRVTADVRERGAVAAGQATMNAFDELLDEFPWPSIFEDVSHELRVRKVERA